MSVSLLPELFPFTLNLLFETDELLFLLDCCKTTREGEPPLLVIFPEIVGRAFADSERAKIANTERVVSSAFRSRIV
jgi:hypothetical protein